ncbi:hypothetical protein EON62_00975 [archaeon]|nr:MAG: hypothetical protein EON62_00975 [archaeon]
MQFDDKSTQLPWSTDNNRARAVHVPPCPEEVLCAVLCLLGGSGVLTVQLLPRVLEFLKHYDATIKEERASAWESLATWFARAPQSSDAFDARLPWPEILVAGGPTSTEPDSIANFRAALLQHDRVAQTLRSLRRTVCTHTVVSVACITALVAQALQKPGPFPAKLLQLWTVTARGMPRAGGGIVLPVLPPLRNPMAWSSNGVVVAAPWRVDELAKFVRLMRVHGKHFDRIAGDLPLRTTGECVALYYRIMRRDVMALYPRRLPKPLALAAAKLTDSIQYVHAWRTDERALGTRLPRMVTTSTFWRAMRSSWSAACAAAAVAFTSRKSCCSAAMAVRAVVNSSDLPRRSARKYPNVSCCWLQRSSRAATCAPAAARSAVAVASCARIASW